MPGKHTLLLDLWPVHVWCLGVAWQRAGPLSQWQGHVRVRDTSQVSETFGSCRLEDGSCRLWLWLPGSGGAGWGGLGPGPLSAGARGPGSAESTDLTFQSLVLTLRPQFLPSTSQRVQSALWRWTAGSCGEEGRPWSRMVMWRLWERTVLLLAGLPESAGR